MARSDDVTGRAQWHAGAETCDETAEPVHTGQCPLGQGVECLHLGLERLQQIEFCLGPKIELQSMKLNARAWLIHSIHWASFQLVEVSGFTQAKY